MNTCYRHNLKYHPLEGCTACECEPAMLIHTIPEAKDTLAQLEKVSASYEHRIGVVQDRIKELQKELETLVHACEDVYEMTKSLWNDIELVTDDEPPSGYHINELFENEFVMPDLVSCDCPTCIITKPR